MEYLPASPLPKSIVSSKTSQIGGGGGGGGEGKEGYLPLSQPPNKKRKLFTKKATRAPNGAPLRHPAPRKTPLSIVLPLPLPPPPPPPPPPLPLLPASSLWRGAWCVRLSVRFRFRFPEGVLVRGSTPTGACRVGTRRRNFSLLRFDWSVGRSVGSFVDWSVGRLVRSFVDWSVGWLN